MAAKPTRRKSNPNGANQYLYDPRQDLMWSYYINPKSETFSNAYQSAIKAKYGEDASKNITLTEWFKDRCGRMNLFEKAEKVLRKTVEMETIRPVIGAFGAIMVPTGKYDEKGKPIKELLYDENDKLLKIQQDSAKFIADRLGKKHGYTTRTELTGADGKDLPTPIYGSHSTGKKV